MCGIIGYVGKKSCTDTLIDGLKKLEYRGYDSAGIAVIEKDGINIQKSKGKISNLEEKVNKNGKPVGTCGIGHTRWATHGEPSDINAHPHGTNKLALVHNGIIENYVEIKNFLIDKGYTFESETDTECVAKLLDYYYKGDPVDAISKLVTHIRGSYSLGILFFDFKDHLYAVRKDSPLIVGVGNNENFIASDMSAIIKHTKNYYLPEENEIAVLTPTDVTFLGIKKEPIKKELKTATWDVSAAEKNGYDHFMLKEINEQPIAIKDTISSRIKDSMPYFFEDGISLYELSSAKKIFIVACGTAMHAGMVGKYLIESLARTDVFVEIASEFRYKNPILGEGDLVIAISQSGETADTLEAVKLANARGAGTIAIVNVVGSSIAREADSVIYTHAGPEISVASTKAYSVQLSIMYLLALKIAYVRETITKSKCKELTKILSKVPSQLAPLFENTDLYKDIASNIISYDSLLYIGRGLDYALSMEGSLKLKEISYIHSESYAAGELKHGTISLISDGTPVIAVATQSALLEKTLSNIKEVKSRGAMVIIICNETDLDKVDPNLADYIIPIPKVNDLCAPLFAVIPMQYIAYYSALLKGCNIDQPRNLAKSVTVE